MFSMNYIGGSQRASYCLTAALLLVVATTLFLITDQRGQDAGLAGGKHNDRVLKGSSARDEPRRVTVVKYFP